MYSIFTRLKILFSGKLEFEDGSVIRDVSREACEYFEGTRHVVIWVDFQDGIFSNGLVIKSDSISTWLNALGEPCGEIDADKKKEIISKLSDYLKATWREVIVE